MLPLVIILTLGSITSLLMTCFPIVNDHDTLFIYYAGLAVALMLSGMLILGLTN